MCRLTCPQESVHALGALVVAITYPTCDRHGTVTMSFRAEIHREIAFYSNVVPKSRFVVFDGHSLAGSVHDFLLALLRRGLFSVTDVPRTPRVSATDLKNVAEEVAPTSAVNLHTVHRVNAPQLDDMIPPGY